MFIRRVVLVVNAGDGHYFLDRVHCHGCLEFHAGIRIAASETLLVTVHFQRKHREKFNCSNLNLSRRWSVEQRAPSTIRASQHKGAVVRMVSPGCKICFRCGSRFKMTANEFIPNKFFKGRSKHRMNELHKAGPRDIMDIIFHFHDAALKCRTSHNLISLCRRHQRVSKCQIHR